MSPAATVESRSWGGFASHPPHDFRNPVFENRGLQNRASGNPHTSSLGLGVLPLDRCGGGAARQTAVFFFFFYPDRSATVTRHRRAPAGRPSAGVRAGGSSGPWVRLYGREGLWGAELKRGARGCPARPRPSSPVARSVARPRRPVHPSSPPTEPAAGRRYRQGRPPPASAQRRFRRAPRFSNPKSVTSRSSCQ